MYKTKRKTNDNLSTSASTPNLWASNFSSSSKLSRRLRSAFARDIRWKLIKRHFTQEGSILDAGCGFGEWVAFLNSQGLICEGLDYSEILIHRLTQVYPEYSWKCGDINNMPYADDKFSGIISWGVIEHNEAGPYKALKEFWRVLKEGGKIIVTVPRDTPESRKSVQTQFPESDDAKFFEFLMTEKELRKFVQDAAFEVLDSGILLNGACLALLSPKLYMMSRGLTHRILQRMVRLLFSWNKRLYPMQYCVGYKPPS